VNPRSVRISDTAKMKMLQPGRTAGSVKPRRGMLPTTNGRRGPNMLLNLRKGFHAACRLNVAAGLFVMASMVKAKAFLSRTKFTVFGASLRSAVRTILPFVADLYAA
jgi:hypothetical protein